MTTTTRARPRQAQPAERAVSVGVTSDLGSCRRAARRAFRRATADAARAPDVQPEAPARRTTAPRRARCPGRGPARREGRAHLDVRARRATPARTGGPLRRARFCSCVTTGGVALDVSLPPNFQATITSAVSDRDPGERDEHDYAARSAALRWTGRARGAPRRRRPPARRDDVARVVLVDVELAVEAEVLGVRPQEALDVRLRREHSNCSSSSARMYFARIFVASSTCGVVESLAHPRLTQAVADLEHAAGL